MAETTIMAHEGRRVFFPSCSFASLRDQTPGSYNHEVVCPSLRFAADIQAIRSEFRILWLRRVAVEGYGASELLSSRESRRLNVTDQELKEMIADLVRSQAETDRQLKESAAEADRRQKEADRRQKQTDRQISRVDKQVGEIGNKFGRFTEGMAEPSMRKLLERFGMTAIQTRALFRNPDWSRTLEVDMLGYDTDDLREEIYIVEVKSLLTPEGVTQALKTITDFRELGPVALRHRPIYGVIAAVDIPKSLEEAVTQRGLYLARINDDTFQLLTPPDFKPRLFVHQTPLGGKLNGRANGRPKKKKKRKE
jgi:hypothetical protein